jgi:hypothetical protein
VIDPIVWRAVQQAAWMEGMQKHLIDTATALRENPASVLTPFQKILRRPSFFAYGENGNWTILFGPRSIIQPAILKTVEELALPALPVAPLRVFDFVVPQPTALQLTARYCKAVLRSLHQWLMHPVIDTRESS